MNACLHSIAEHVAYGRVRWQEMFNLHDPCAPQPPSSLDQQLPDELGKLWSGLLQVSSVRLWLAVWRVCLSVCLSVYLSVCWSVVVPVCLSVCLSVCLPTSVPLSLSLCSRRVCWSAAT